MNVKKLVSSVAAFAMTASVFAGFAVNASAETVEVYSRAAADWSATDVGEGEWSGSPTATAGTGLVLSYKNGAAETSKALSIADNSIVQVTGTWVSGGAPGRSGSYDYIYLSDDIYIKAYTQDQKSAIVINDTETDIGVSGRNATYTFDITIDTSMKTIEAFTLNGSEVKTPAYNTIVLNSGKVSELKFGHYKAGREGYASSTKLSNITVKETQQTVTTAAYTINYMLDGVTTVKQVTGTAAVDAKIPTDASFWVTENDILTKYMITAATAPEYTVSATEEDNVWTVPVRVADTYDYVVNAKAGEAAVELERGTVVEGETINYKYPRYLNNGGVLYSKNATDSQYKSSLLANSDAAVDGVVTINLDYAVTDINNVVYYSEAENVEGLTVTNYGNIDIRSSNAKAAYAESDVTLTNLPAGKYVVYGVIHAGSSAGAHLNFTLGENQFSFDNASSSNWVDVNSAEFTLTQATDLVFNESGAKNAALDFIYVVKTGEAPKTLPTVEVTAVTDYTEAGSKPARTYTGTFTVGKNNYSVSGVKWIATQGEATKDATSTFDAVISNTTVVTGLVVQAESLENITVSAECVAAE